MRALLFAILLLIPTHAFAADWAPVKGQPYPDLELIDQTGKTFKLSDLKGKVLLIEPIGMNCHACQAFSGAHEKGVFAGGSAQPGLPDVGKMLKTYGKGTKLPNKKLVLVQLLFYDMKNAAPTPADAKAWAEHFGFERKKNEIVAVPVTDIRSPAVYGMIPGFHLVDKKFTLRSSAAGHAPEDDLYRTLFPMVPKLLK